MTGRDRDPNVDKISAEGSFVIVAVAVVLVTGVAEQGRSAGDDAATRELRSRGARARARVQGDRSSHEAVGSPFGGLLTVYESSYPEGVPHPLRIHHDAAESFYLLEGCCRFQVGDAIIDADAGAFVSIPGVTHGLVPVGGRARTLVIFSPVAMEGGRPDCVSLRPNPAATASLSRSPRCGFLRVRDRQQYVPASSGEDTDRFASRGSCQIDGRPQPTAG